MYCYIILKYEIFKILALFNKRFYDYFVKLENGEEKLFGPYETPDELLAAVESFCNDQVKLGNMDQSEAREIVSQCVQN